MLRQLIHLYKYSRIRTLVQPLADFLYDAVPRDESFDWVTAVPLHWRRRWQRGFNQSELLARAISKRVGAEFAPVLRRLRATETQAGLSNTARRRNVATAFRCTRPQAVRGKRLLLIDDVMTTGSTAAACALALKRAGALRVALVTLARVDRRIERNQEVARLTIGGTS